MAATHLGRGFIEKCDDVSKNAINGFEDGLKKGMDCNPTWFTPYC